MSNEDLAALIKSEDPEAIMQLWEQIQQFVKVRALNYILEHNKSYELDDLMQSGFIAMLKAARAYDNQSASFIHFLTFYLYNEFKTSNGFKRSRNPDPAITARSIDDPISEDGDTLSAIIPDDNDYFEETERRIFNEQLRQQLNELLATLPDDQQQVIYCKYYKHGKTITNGDAGKQLNITSKEVQAKELKALRQIRQKGRSKLIDFYTPFYHHISVNAFLSQHESIIERCVIIRERINRANH